jgi:hypothetical protein
MMRNESEAPNPDSSLWRAPLVRAAAVLAIPTAILWGVYLQSSLQLGLIPHGLYSWVNNVGLLVYSMTAMLCALLAGAVLLRSLKLQRWQPEDRLAFYGGLILGAAFQLTGLQFLVFGEWRLGYTFLRFILQGGTLLLIFLLLVQLLKFEWGYKNDEENLEKPKSSNPSPPATSTQSDEGG